MSSQMSGHYTERYDAPHYESIMDDKTITEAQRKEFLLQLEVDEDRQDRELEYLEELSYDDSESEDQDGE